MARAAFLTDRFFHKIGLHGQSFIPLLAGFGCSVPAVMGARTLKNPKDRVVTILVTPLMSCGARLPVYTLLAGAFFPKEAAGNVIFSIYLIGVILAVCLALIFRKSLFKGESSPFVMELPPYRRPTLRGILWHLWQKAWFYLKKAGTIILVASIIIWVMTNYPQPDFSYAQEQDIQNHVQTGLSGKQQLNRPLPPDDPDKILQIRRMEYSFAGRLGKFFEPISKPLGFDWKINIALFSGFAAKEIVVSTLSVLYQIEDTEEEDNKALRQALKKDEIFSPLVAYVFMLFTLIYLPCIAVLAVIKAELGSWKWVIFVAVYTISLAWIISLIVYQAGRLLMGL
jgi:ferrous iron transport protein B